MFFFVLCHVLGGGLLSLFFLPFHFLMFACFFETNFPKIPFLKPKLLSFLAVYLFFCCFCLWCMFLPFCFYVSFVSFFFILFVLFLVLLSVYETTPCFPYNSGVLMLCWLKGSLFGNLLPFKLWSIV